MIKVSISLCKNFLLNLSLPSLLRWNPFWPMCGSSHPEVFWEKGVLKICRKSTGEHPCRSVISIKLLCNFVEITLRHGCSPVNLLHILRAPFIKNTSGWLLLDVFNTNIAIVNKFYMKFWLGENNVTIWKSFHNFVLQF